MWVHMTLRMRVCVCVCDGFVILRWMVVLVPVKVVMVDGLVVTMPVTVVMVVEEVEGDDIL